MRRLLTLIPVAVVLLLLLYFVISPVFGQPFYELGEGPIRDIEIDTAQGQIIVVSGHTVFIILASNGQIIEEFQIPGIFAKDIKAGLPQDDFLFGIAGCSEGGIQFSIDRTTTILDYTVIGPKMMPFVQLQDTDGLFAVCRDQKVYVDELSYTISSFLKTGLTSASTWPCIDWPMNAIYDSTNGLIIIGEGMSRPHSSGDGDTGPWGEGVSQMSRVAIYDPNREGEIVDKFTAYGTVAGLAQASDGTIIAGLAGDKEWETKAATFAILGHPIEYIEIENLQVIRMDYDSATDRVICSAWDYVTEEANNVIVWDYNTREYEIIDTGVEAAQVIKFLDGKLYASNGEDNKVYVITIDE